MYYCKAGQLLDHARFIINTSTNSKTNRSSLKVNALAITKPSHPHAVFIMGHLKKHSQTVCSVRERSSLCWLLFYSLQGGLFHWRYQMITYSVFRVDVVVKASMSHCGGAGLWHATKKGKLSIIYEVQTASIMLCLLSAWKFKAQRVHVIIALFCNYRFSEK